MTRKARSGHSDRHRALLRTCVRWHRFLNIQVSTGDAGEGLKTLWSRTQHGIKSCNLSHHQTQSHRWPSSGICELGEDCLRTLVGRQNPKGDDNCQENDNVEDQETILNARPNIGGPNVHHTQHDNRREHEKGTLPCLWFIIRVVDDE